MTLTVAAAFFLLLLDGTILNTALPAVAQGLGVEPLALSGAVTVYLLAGAAVLPLASWLGDRFGLRRTFVSALALFTAASLLCGLAQDATQLVIARALQGLGGGLMMPAGRTLAMHGARKEDIVGIAALLTWPALFAPVLGPPLGGLIAAYGSWRWVFLVNVPLGALALLLVLRWMPQEAPKVSRPLDSPGAVGAALGLVLLLAGLEWTGHVVGDAGSLPASLLMSATGIALLAWTVRHLLRSPHPVVSLAPLELHTFRATAVAGGALATMALQSMPFLLPLFFQLGLGRSPVEAGLLLLPYTLANVGMKSVTTPVMMRFGFRRVLVVSGAANAMALAAMVLLGPGSSWLQLGVLLVFAGCARSMLLTANQTLMFADVSPMDRGAASSLLTISMQVASALGVAVGAILLAVAQLARDQPVLAPAEFHFAFLAMAVLCALGTVSFWRLPASAGSALTQRAA